MKKESKLRWLLILTIAYIIFFSWLGLINRNYDFFYDGLIMAAIVFLLIRFNGQLKLSIFSLTSLVFLGALHIFGRNVYQNGIRVYDSWLIPSFFRFDNFMHLFGGFIAGIIAFSLLVPYLDKKLKKNKILLTIIIILMASGIGAFHEVLELFAVLLFGVQEAIGDYFNNAFDLFFNLFGAALASIYALNSKPKNE